MCHHQLLYPALDALNLYSSLIVLLEIPSAPTVPARKFQMQVTSEESELARPILKLMLLKSTPSPTFFNP